MNNLANNTTLVSKEILLKISRIQGICTMSLLITFAIPSLICFLIIFYYFIRLNKKLIFDRVCHHVILCILISDFMLITTELPLSLYYLSAAYVKLEKICTFWIFWDYALESASLFLTMFASIERYLLVFYRQSIINHKLLLHYIPLGFTCFYPFGIYIYFVVVFPCKRNYQYDLTNFACGGPCYLTVFISSVYDTIVNVMVPPCIILVFNLLIITHVIRSKHKVSPLTPVSDTLKRNRRMILQLLAISLMSLITWIPWVVVILVQNFYDPLFASDFINIVIHYLPYFTSFVSPFLALIGLPEIRKEFTKAIKQVATNVRLVGLARI